MLPVIDYPSTLSPYSNVQLTEEQRAVYSSLYARILEECKKHPVKIIIPYRLERTNET